jgi:hypothetical protein
LKEILRIISRVFDDFDGGKISKQHLGMLSSRPNYEIQLMVKIIFMCLSPKVFIRLGVEKFNIQRWKVRYFCVLNFAPDHYFAAKK